MTAIFRGFGFAIILLWWTATSPLLYLKALPPPFTMTGEETRTLWCVVEGESAPFYITVGVDVKINHLRWKINGVLGGIDESRASILLWKVSISYRPRYTSPDILLTPNF